MFSYQPQRDCLLCPHIDRHMAVVNETEKLTVSTDNVDTVVVKICYQNMTLAVCSDVIWIEWFLCRCGKTSVRKPEFPCLVDHHSSMGYPTCFVLEMQNAEMGTIKSYTAPLQIINYVLTRGITLLEHPCLLYILQRELLVLKSFCKHNDHKEG